MKRILFVLTLSLLGSHHALAWGDSGHRVIALIAEHYLTPDVRRTVTAMLAADPDSLTQHDIASESTWADKYRNQHRATSKWHYVDIELDHPDIVAACFGREPLPAETLASNGPPDACVLDKINQFSEELNASGVDPEERVIALKFILHFVGDMHQPLHSSDNHDRGGNLVKVIVDGFNHRSHDELHGYWDTQFVEDFGRSPRAIADQLLGQITPEQKAKWEQGSVDDWAMETFLIAKRDVYGDPPLSKEGVQHLDAAYVAQAEKDAALLLSRAGVRLAFLLNRLMASKSSQ